MINQILVNYARESIITTRIITPHLIQKIIFIVTGFSGDYLVRSRLKGNVLDMRDNFQIHQLKCDAGYRTDLH